MNKFVEKNWNRYKTGKILNNYKIIKNIKVELC